MLTDRSAPTVQLTPFKRATPHFGICEAFSSRENLPRIRQWAALNPTRQYKPKERYSATSSKARTTRPTIRFPRAQHTHAAPQDKTLWDLPCEKAAWLVRDSSGSPQLWNSSIVGAGKEEVRILVPPAQLSQFGAARRRVPARLTPTIAPSASTSKS